MSLPSSAEDIKIIQVWQASDRRSVIQDIDLPSNVRLEVMDVSLVERGNQLINQWLSSQVNFVQDPVENERRLKAVAPNLIETAEFAEAKKLLEAGGYAIQGAIYSRVTKVPAIVFNESDIVYGVYSLRKAIAIFQRNGQ